MSAAADDQPPPSPAAAAAPGTTAMLLAPLLPDWEQQLDADSGRNVYVNARTGERTFDRAAATGLDTAALPQQTGVVGLSEMTAGARRNTLFVAKTKGVSGPVLNNDAAVALSALNPHNYGEMPRPVRLPTLLQQEIQQFHMEGFARKFFTTHKKGILRRKVPMESMLRWTKDMIPSSLLNLSKDAAKEAVNAWKLLQRAMGDRTGTQKFKGQAPQYLALVELGMGKAALRDELYVQLIKQLTQNPHEESLKLGWELMCTYVNSFPPSKDLEHYLLRFFDDTVDGTDSETTAQQAAYCKKKLPRMSRVGAKGKSPSLAEVERFAEAPFKPSLFGETLEDVMDQQKAERPSEPVPRILSFLCESVLQLNGQKFEGIFRVPGDVEQVTELQLRVDRASYELGSIADASVPASLLKLWLRELADPLIPAEFYSEAVQHAEDADKTVLLITRLSDLSRRVIFHVISFLQTIADPANQPATKMNVNNLAMVFAPSFLRCPSDNPQTIFENTKFEQSFVRNLILHLNTGNPVRASLLEQAQ